MATFRKPRWRDPRLGVGILLVAISVALGGWVFAQADKTYPVFVAGTTIAVGDGLEEVELRVVEVNLGSAKGHYLDPATMAQTYADPAQHVFNRPIPAGELVPLTALGERGDLPYRPVSIVVTNAAPLVVGDVVDLWVVAQEIGGREPQEPQLVATGLQVRGVGNDDSLFSTGASLVVQVLVHEDEVGKVLGAISINGKVTLVPHLGG